MAKAAQNQFSEAVHTNFSVNRPAVGLGRIQAKLQAVSDVLIGVAFRQQLIDLRLPPAANAKTAAASGNNQAGFGCTYLQPDSLQRLPGGFVQEIK